MPYKYFNISEFTIPTDSNIRILPIDYLNPRLLHKRGEKWFHVQSILSEVFATEIIDLLLDFVTENHWSEHAIVIATSTDISGLDGVHIPYNKGFIKSFYFDNIGHIIFTPKDACIEIVGKASTNYFKEKIKMLNSYEYKFTDKDKADLKILIQKLNKFNANYKSLFKALLKNGGKDVEDRTADHPWLSDRADSIKLHPDDSMPLHLKEDNENIFFEFRRAYLENVGFTYFAIVISKDIKIYPLAISDLPSYNKHNTETDYYDDIKYGRLFKKALLDTKAFFNLNDFSNSGEFHEDRIISQKSMLMSISTNMPILGKFEYLCLSPKIARSLIMVAENRFLVLYNFNPITLEEKNAKKPENKKPEQVIEEEFRRWCHPDIITHINNVDIQSIEQQVEQEFLRWCQPDTIITLPNNVENRPTSDGAIYDNDDLDTDQ